MIAAQRGVIINMASMAGQRGSANHAHYAAAKGGVLAFTRSLAREVIQHNIRVNAVSPGRIETELLMATSAEDYGRWMADTPARRLGTAKEIAAAVVFLATPAAAYMVGETVAVNGGLIMEYSAKLGTIRWIRHVVNQGFSRMENLLYTGGPPPNEPTGTGQKA
jgi:3-oxoacyl-[acyl-carrier protein] reductase